MKRTERLTLIVAGIFGILLLVGLLYRAIYLPPFDATGQQLTRTSQLVFSLSSAFKMFWTEYNRFPTGDQSSISRILQGEDVDGQNPREIIFFGYRQQDLDASGRVLDAWGRPFDIGFSADRQQVTIKSYGKNGKDDGGRGDDIVETVSPPPAK